MPGKPPYFPLYVNDLENDGKVVAMNTEQFGAYVHLLCKAWLEEPAGTIPDDDNVLSYWARVSAKRWKAIKEAVLAPFDKRADGRWHQKRMKAEAAKVKVRSERARESAERRWNDANAYANASNSHAVGICETDATQHCVGNARAYDSDSEYGSESLHLRDEGSGGKGSQVNAKPPPGSWLAQQWLHKHRGPKTKATEINAVMATMDELLRRGIPQDEIEKRIADKDRDRSEPIWEFAKHWKPNHAADKHRAATPRNRHTFVPPAVPTDAGAGGGS